MPTIAMLSSQGVPAKLDASAWPRIALVTPVFNSVRYIEATIRSVLAQDYPNLDYFIVDGGSTDGTLEIIRKYESQISGWISEPDNGMYDAINKGFARTNGEIMGWISATDMLQLGGLSVAASVFRDLPAVEWITGRPTILSEEGMTVMILALTRWSQYRFLAGANRTIQQESTFWRRSLWEKAGGRVDASRRNAADFELWVRFFRHAEIYPVDALIGGFRIHDDSLGLQNLEACYRIHDEYVEAELDQVRWGKWLRFSRRIGRAVKPIPIVRGIWRLLLTDPLYHRPGADWPPIIEYQWNKWGFQRK
jgi:glycosyltransferase involved in cell wall biosynthesis